MDKETVVWPIESYNGNKVPILHTCIRGHEWKAHPSNILAGHGCPICTGKGSKTHEQYLQQLKDIDATVTPKEEYRTAQSLLEHECLICSFVWKTTPSSVVNQRTGCPKCSKTGFNPGVPANLYYIKIGKYYKIGITNKTISDRFRSDNDKPIKVLMLKHFEDGRDAKAKESEILKEFSPVYAGKYLRSGGNTELFDWDILQLDNI